MKLATYNETIDFLYHQLPMYQHQGSKAIKKDLTNVRILLEALGNPQDTYPIIHIAGTNGKGTVAHLMTAVLMRSGRKVGLYTSPHYVDFRERIKVDGAWIDQNDVVQFVNEHMDLIRKVRPSFFEITVAMAFRYFEQVQVDIAVIETGLGGRLDSTNIVHPIISAITNISLDHAHILGPDIYTIAGEKAGIIKAETPVVIGHYQIDCDHVFWKAASEKNAPISFASILWQSKSNNDYTHLQRRYSEDVIKLVVPDGGPFIKENITTTLEIIFQCNQRKLLHISMDILQEAISEFRTITNYIGRWQVLSDTPKIIADSAHNFQALEEVVNYVQQAGYDRIHFVIGFVQEKDLSNILALFDPQHHYYFSKPTIDRGLPVEDLVLAAKKYGLEGDQFDHVRHALEAAKANYKSGDLIYIGGSSFIVGDLLESNIPESSNED